jgi:hypothetical protein
MGDGASGKTRPLAQVNAAGRPYVAPVKAESPGLGWVNAADLV